MNHLVSRCTTTSLSLSLLLTLTFGKQLDPRRPLTLVPFVKSISSSGMIKCGCCCCVPDSIIPLCTHRVLHLLWIRRMCYQCDAVRDAVLILTQRLLKTKVSWQGHCCVHLWISMERPGNMWLHFVCTVVPLTDAVLSSNISKENQFYTVCPWHIAQTVGVVSWYIQWFQHETLKACVFHGQITYFSVYLLILFMPWAPLAFY